MCVWKSLAPYASYITTGLRTLGIVLILSVGVWAGCSAGKQQNSKEIDKLNAQIVTLNLEAMATNSALHVMNVQVETNKRLAEERELLAKTAAAEAEKAKRALADQHKKYEQRLKDASKDPDCEAFLEMKLCPLLQEY